ncbi:GNAT family N-acetyltransferase [Streptomyces indicus]|uniref:Predicted N-acetyltransferase YhbS n=1 Tax=Streptomyces indicus TaxID=417292 RepID=A0A1G9FRK0_9ACTN|nr:GNAT family N-acetyltransferase [Streptomyces indicus]SDK91038.1 Predicted N-acetyltransferase YhbS [Streptomyces indicus]
MDFRIRAALPEEYAPLGELTVQVYLADGLLDYGEEDPYIPVLRDVEGRAATSEVLVAVDGDQLLGGVTFALYGTPQAQIARPGEAEFRALAVAHAGRGRGAGEALVRACVDRAREAGCTGVALSTQHMMHSAHRIYERLGFVRTPERDWNPLADRDDLMLWAYTLTF